MTIHKERILNRHLNKRVYDYIMNHSVPRAEVRKTFVAFGANAVSRALNELIFFDLISENPETFNLEVINH